MSSKSRESRGMKNVFSRAWKALKGKWGSQGAWSSGTRGANVWNYRDTVSPASLLAESRRRSSSASQSRVSSRKSSPVEAWRRSLSASQSRVSSRKSSPVEAWRRSLSASQSRASSQKSSRKSSPVEARRRSSSSSQSDDGRYNSGECDPWRASYKYGALAYPGDNDQGRVRSYPRSPQQDFTYSLYSNLGHYYSPGLDNFDSYVRDDEPVPDQPPPHTSYGYYRPSEEDPNNCAVM